MEKVNLSWKSWVLIAFGFLAVGFVGILAGNWFVGWRQASAYSGQPAPPQIRDTAILKEGDRFPEISLLDVNGRPIGIQDILAGRKTSILYVSPGCGPCESALSFWATLKDKIPEDIRVIAIAEGSLESAVHFASEAEFPYPVYADTGHVLQTQFAINSTPRFLGVREDGQIAYFTRGSYYEITPLTILEILNEE